MRKLKIKIPTQPFCGCCGTTKNEERRKSFFSLEKLKNDKH